MGVGRTNICVYGGSSGGTSEVSTVDLPINLKTLTATKGDCKIRLDWTYTNTTDLSGIQFVYKTGSYPTSPSDGKSKIVTGTTSTNTEITGLTNDTAYYVRAYPYRDINGTKYYQTHSTGSKVTATPRRIIGSEETDISGSKFVTIPKCSWAELGIGTSTETFPAFIVNGKEIDELSFGKYEASVTSGKAVSKKGVAPKAEVTFDEAINYCKQSGTGWHLATRLEWMLVALWCANNNITPEGNISGSAVQNTGAGGNTYSHNGKADGIWDMCGNVWEWNGGFRIVQGELQVISKSGTFGNDAADSSLSQTADSTYWWAINGTTGALIKPNGSGTTANSLKISSSGWTTGAASNYSGTIYSIKCNSSICEKAKNILIALGLLKPATMKSDPGDYLWLYKGTEYLGYAGGYCGNGAMAGVFAFICSNDRSSSIANVGFRPAFVRL